MVPTVEESGMEQERWERLWNKNWEILLAVLHQEDFPLLRDSQQYGQCRRGRHVARSQRDRQSGLPA